MVTFKVPTGKKGKKGGAVRRLFYSMGKEQVLPVGI
jgi:hypothetical protein